MNVRRTVVRSTLLVAVASGMYYGYLRITEERPILVRIATVAHGKVENSVANTRAGTVYARHRARLSPAIGGQVAELLVREGECVEPGQVLLRLWSKDLEAQLVLSRSELARSEAIAESAKVRAELAQREAERLKSLLAREITSVEEVDQAESKAKTSAADHRAAMVGREVAAARIGTIEAALEKTVLSAPFAGIVAEVNAELGEFVTPSPTGIPTPPAVDLIDPSSLYISAPLDEVDTPLVSPGQTVRVTLDAFDDEEFAGTVTRAAPYVLDREKQARTVEVEVAIQDPEQASRLMPGYSADIEVVLETHANVLWLPTEALRPDRSVLVVDPETNRLEARKIETGLGNWRRVEVISGLAEGELVVVSLGRVGVREGALVNRER